MLKLAILNYSFTTVILPFTTQILQLVTDQFFL